MRKSLGIKIEDRFTEITSLEARKQLGNTLDPILFAMEEQGMEVPLELMELKQWLRFKGNSRRESGDTSLWQIKTKEV